MGKNVKREWKGKRGRVVLVRLTIPVPSKENVIQITRYSCFHLLQANCSTTRQPQLEPSCELRRKALDQVPCSPVIIRSEANPDPEKKTFLFLLQTSDSGNKRENLLNFVFFPGLTGLVSFLPSFMRSCEQRAWGWETLTKRGQDSCLQTLRFHLHGESTCQTTKYHPAPMQCDSDFSSALWHGFVFYASNVGSCLTVLLCIHWSLVSQFFAHASFEQHTFIKKMPTIFSYISLQALWCAYQFLKVEWG